MAIMHSPKMNTITQIAEIILQKKLIPKTAKKTSSQNQKIQKDITES